MNAPLLREQSAVIGYVYLRSEPQLWTVGFYKQNGEWEPESDHGSAEKAARRVAFLNGSNVSFEE